MIKLGIAGFGWLSENVYMPILSQIKDVEVVSIYDIEYDRVQDYINKYNLKKVNLYTEYDKFLESDIDAVLIATPNNIHAELAIESLKANKHVLCEKPLTISTCELDRIIKVKRESNGKFVAAYVNRFREDIHFFDKINDEYKIGEVKRIDISWIRNKGIPRPGTWFTNKKKSGGGVLIDLGPHMIDLGLKYVKDKKIKQAKLKSWYDTDLLLQFKSNWFNAERLINDRIDVERAIIGEIEFEKVQMQVNLSWASNYNGDFTIVTIEGEEGTVQLRTLFGLSDHRFFKEGNITLKKPNIEINRSFELNQQLSLDAFKRMIEDFIERIQLKENDISELESYRSVVEVIEILYKNETVTESTFEPCVEGIYE